MGLLASIVLMITSSTIMKYTLCKKIDIRKIAKFVVHVLALFALRKKQVPS